MENKSQEPLEFERRRTAYCSKFALSHLSSFRPHYQRGETLGKGPEIWRNVSEHCLVAGIFADILSEEFGLPEAERTMVVNAALLHDWYKKFESMAIAAGRRDQSLSLQTLDDIKKRDGQAIREMGVADGTIRLT